MWIELSPKSRTSSTKGFRSEVSLLSLSDTWTHSFFNKEIKVDLDGLSIVKKLMFTVVVGDNVVVMVVETVVFFYGVHKNVVES